MSSLILELSNGSLINLVQVTGTPGSNSLLLSNSTPVTVPLDLYIPPGEQGLRIGFVNLGSADQAITESTTQSTSTVTDIYHAWGSSIGARDLTANRILTPDASGTVTSTIYQLPAAPPASYGKLRSDSTGVLGWDISDAASGERTGFPNRTDSSISYVEGTRTFTITGNHTIYIKGVDYAKTTASVTHANSTGLHYAYYDVADGVLKVAAGFPGTGQCLVASTYYNASTGKGILGEERHGMTMDADTHAWMHTTVGTRYVSGLTGTFTNTTYDITSGSIRDEDILLGIDSQTTCRVFYKSGSDYVWTAPQATYYYTSGGNLYYDNAGTLTAVGSNRYIAVWVFATNDIATPIWSLLGQRTDATLADARANNTYESLSLGTLPFAEMKLLYRVLLRNDITPYEETTDYRSVSNLPAGTYVATDHGILTGLLDDDHTQYPLNNGITTGYVPYATAARTLANSVITQGSYSTVPVVGIDSVLGALFKLHVGDTLEPTGGSIWAYGAIGSSTISAGRMPYADTYQRLIDSPVRSDGTAVGIACAVPTSETLKVMGQVAIGETGVGAFSAVKFVNQNFGTTDWHVSANNQEFRVAHYDGTERVAIESNWIPGTSTHEVYVQTPAQATAASTIVVSDAGVLRTRTVAELASDLGTFGATGIMGPAGATGLVGATGLMGATGIQGQQGVTGLIGATGAVGQAGATGLRGVTGLVGSQGATGLIGSTGVGAQGITGAVGATGVGAAGVTGLRGTTGVNGIQGATGVATQGVTGLIGLTGASVQGVTGLRGVTGLQGTQGTTGLVGAAGATGVIGAHGVTPNFVPRASSATAFENSIIYNQSGNVGIGVTGASSYSYNANAQLIVGNTAGYGSIGIVADSSSSSDLAFSDGTAGTARYAGLLQYDHTQDKLNIFTGGVHKHVIGATGIGVGRTSTPPHPLTVDGPDRVTMARFGDRWPMYMMRGNAGVGFGLYYDGAWKYGPSGGSTAYGYVWGSDPISGGGYLSASTAAGADGDTATVARVLSFDASSNVIVGNSTSVLYPLSVFHATASVLDVHTNRETAGDLATIYLSTVNSTAYRKSAILFEATGSGGLGTLYICNNSSVTSVNASKADSRIAVTSAGNVLVNAVTSRGVGNITGKLQVETTDGNTVSIARNSGDNGGPYVSIGKSRGGMGGVTAVVADDYLGLITFAGADGTDLDNNAAYITCMVDGVVATGKVPGRLAFLTTPVGGVGPTEKMRITNDGKILIGTTAVRRVGYSDANLHIEGLTNATSGLSIVCDSAGTSIPNLNFGRAQSDALGSVVAPELNDNLGIISFCSADGTDMESISAQIRGVCDGACGSNDVPGRLEFLTTVDGGASSTERMRITSDGYILHGLTSMTPVSGVSLTSQTNIGMSVLRESNNTSPGYLTFGKSRGAPTTIVVDGDEIGRIAWAASDGTDINTPAAYIMANVDGTPGADDMPGRLTFWTTADGAASPTERMRISNDGLVKIVNLPNKGSAATEILVHDGNVIKVRTAAQLASDLGTFGATGVQGIQGATGAVGSQGVTGLRGVTGIQGLQGATGVGAQGTTGLVGVTGVGAQGITGLRGATGIQGLQGVTGLGATGVVGSQGITGLRGTTGLAGTNGSQGVTGLVGSQGSTGAVGPAGVTGLRGVTGVNGTQGVTGLIGATGLRGAAGVTGLQAPYLGAYYGVAANGPNDLIGLPGVWFVNGSDMTCGGIEATQVKVDGLRKGSTLASDADTGSISWEVAGGTMAAGKYALVISNGDTDSHGIRSSVNGDDLYALYATGKIKVTKVAELNSGLATPNWGLAESGSTLVLSDGVAASMTLGEYTETNLLRLNHSGTGTTLEVRKANNIYTNCDFATDGKVVASSYVYASDLRQSGDNQTYKTISLSGSLSDSDVTIAGWATSGFTAEIRWWQVGHTFHFAYNIKGTGSGTGSVTLTMNGTRIAGDDYATYLWPCHIKNSGTQGTGTCETVNSGTGPAVTVQFYPGATIGGAWTDAVTREVRGTGFFEMYSGLTLFSDS
jgi:hypothetical protein